MLMVSELIVLLWLVPVVVNIILPLAVFCAWSIGRLFNQLSQATSAVKAESSHPQEQRIPSAAGSR